MEGKMYFHKFCLCDGWAVSFSLTQQPDFVGAFWVIVSGAGVLLLSVFFKINIDMTHNLKHLGPSPKMVEYVGFYALPQT